MSKLKIAGISLISLFLIFSIAVISWFTYIKLEGAEVIVSDTYYVGLQTLPDGSDTQYFVEVNYLSNETNNGVALFEVKFNYLMDENQTAFFSQGLQYTNKDEVDFTDDVKKTKEYYDKNFWGWETIKWNYISYQVHGLGTQRYNYMSADDYATTLESTNPIDNDSFFKIKIGDDIYGMKFKGQVATMDKYKEFDAGNWTTQSYKTFTDYNVDYFVAALFNSVQSLENGTTRACVFEFGDLFDYYEYDQDLKQYKQDKVELDKAVLISRDIKSYYSILIHKDKVGATKASDSLFNCVDGTSNFNVSNANSQDYFYGRTTVHADIEEGASEFSIVELTDTKVALKLNDSFNKAYLPYAEKLELVVLINLDILTSQGLEFMGFTADCGLDKYNVVSCKTVQTIDGELVYSEVAYD